jgi:hypothetical protein
VPPVELVKGASNCHLVIFFINHMVIILNFLGF